MTPEMKNAINSAIEHITQASEALSDTLVGMQEMSVKQLLENDDEFGMLTVYALALSAMTDDLSGIPGLRRDDI